MNCEADSLDERKELECLKQENKLLTKELQRQVQEKEKLGIDYDEARKYIKELQKQIAHFEGQVKAFKYCISGGVDY